MMKVGKIFEGCEMVSLRVFKGLVFSLLIVGVFLLSSGVFSYARTIGHEIPPGETSFTNSDTIRAQNIQGDNATVSGVYGVYSDYNLDLFENTENGSISALGQVGDASGGSSRVGVEGVYGVGVWGDVGNFTNTGAITATATAGNASGDSSRVGVGGFFGVVIGGDVGNFTNTGTITATATAGNASGDSSGVGVGWVFGVGVGGEVGNFTNTGTISAQVSAGSEIGANSTVTVQDVAGVYISGRSNPRILNSGVIGADIKAGKGAEVSEVAGVRLARLTGGNFTNTGEISVSVDAPEAESVSEAAGIYVTKSGSADNPVYISNPGWVYLWTNAKNADLRTLRIEDGAQVKLYDKFAVLFGQRGVNRRPIYVGSGSTLDLNNADLVAGIGDITLIRWNSPYPLIENNNGTVNGTFNRVLPGWHESNEDLDISVYWWNGQKGDNATVAFNLSYHPRHSVGALGAESSLRVANIMLDRIVGLNTLRAMMMANRKVFLAQSDKGPVASDVGPSLPVYTRKKYRSSFYFYPFYTKIDGDNLKYDADVDGGILGLERLFGERYRVGFFGGYAHADVDYGVRGANGEYQDLYVGGLYADRLAVEGSPWYVGLAAAGYYANHYYDGRTGLNYELKEHADYESWGLEGRLVVGYQFAGKDWKLMPNVGLGITYWDLNDFTTKVSANPVWRRHYSGDDDTYGTLMLGVTGIKYWGEKDRRFFLGGLLRAEAAIGDNDIEIEQSIPALRTGKVDVEEEVSDFSVVGQLELGVKIHGRYSFSLSGGGKYNADYTAYGGRVIFKIDF